MSASVPIALQRTDEGTATANFGNVYETAEFARSTVRSAPATIFQTTIFQTTIFQTAIGRHDHITWHRPDNQGGTP